jgi:hypothetical protein
MHTRILGQVFINGIEYTMYDQLMATIFCSKTHLITVTANGEEKEFKCGGFTFTRTCVYPDYIKISDPPTKK